MAYNFAVAPRMHHQRSTQHGLATDVYTLGQNAPTCFTPPVSSTAARRTADGRFGDCVLILGQVIKHLSGHPDSHVIGNYDFSTFKRCGWSFEIILSAMSSRKLDEARAGESLSFHFVPPLHGEWHDDPGKLKIERISDIPLDHYDAENSTKRRWLSESIRHGFCPIPDRDFNLGCTSSTSRTAAASITWRICGNHHLAMGSPRHYAMTCSI